MTEKTKKERDYNYEMKRRKTSLSVPFQRAASVTSDTEERIRKKYKDRGKRGIKQMLKEKDAVNKQFYRDADLAKEYGKDAYKAKSFGVRKYSQGGMVHGKSFKGIF